MKETRRRVPALFFVLALAGTLAACSASGAASSPADPEPVENGGASAPAAETVEHELTWEETKEEVWKELQEMLGPAWEENSAGQSVKDPSDYQGYGGTLWRPDGTVVEFPGPEEEELSPAYPDFAVRFSEQDILFNTDYHGKILLHEDFIGSRYVCFSMEALAQAEGMPYPDIEDHVVYVDVSEHYIEEPQPGTIYVVK